MALSQDIKTQFAKVAIGDKKTKSEETINGTYKTINGKEYVQLDGSDILTPVVSTVIAETGDRVKVLIKEHTATITGNITSPSARSKDLDNIKDEVDEFGNTIKQLDNSIQQQGNSIIQLENNINQQQNTINQFNNVINEQNNKILSIDNEITQQGNTILEMNNQVISMGNQVESINNTVKSQNNKITEMNNTVISLNNTVTQYDNIIEQQGNTIKQFGNDIESVNNTVKIHDSDITILNSGFDIVDGKLTGLSEIIVNSLKTAVLNTGYAQIDFANINMAAVTKIFSDSGIIKDLVTQDGHITGELVGVTIKGDLIIANTLKADRLIVKGENGLYYKLNLDALGKATVDSDEKYQNGLDGKTIIAHSITADRIQVTDLVAFGATIGGFKIEKDSIHSIAKTSPTSIAMGLYLGNDGQLSFGDDNQYIKHYKDSAGKWHLEISTSDLKIKLRDTYTPLNDALNDIETDIGNAATKDDVDIINDKLDTNTTDIGTLKGQYADISAKNGALEISIHDVDSSVKKIENNYATQEDLKDVEVTKVITTTGYKFDKDGLYISKTGAKTKSIINEKGLDVKNSNDKSVLFAGYDETLGDTVFKGSNLILNNSSRFENYVDINSNQAVGCFWVG